MSVHQRHRRNGTTFWVVRWRAGGRDTKQSSRSFDRKRDADLFESDRRRRRQLGQLPTSEATTQTLESFVQEWWRLYAEPQLAPKTLLVYHDLWRLHVRAQLGGIRLGHLTPELVERFQANMRATGVGDPTIRKTLTLIQGVLKRAVLWGRIATNPVALVAKPRQRRTHLASPPSIAAVETMRRALLENGLTRDATLICVLAYSGLRPGEALALRWADVRRASILAHSAVSLGDVKETTTRRARNVRLLTPLAEDLAAWRALTDHSADGDLVFPRPDGLPWQDHDWRNWRRRVFKTATRHAGSEGARPYDLRHLFVSLPISEGRSIVDIAAQAGHAPRLAYDTYGHVLYDVDPTNTRPAEDVIRDARAAGVPTVFPRPTSPPDEKRLESAQLQGKHEALSGTRTLDPLLTIQVAKEEQEGTDGPSSPSNAGDSRV